jgi:ATP-dependent DNA helicase DinG
MVGLHDAVALLDAIRSGLPDGGEARPGQVEMTRAVTRALEDGTALVVQAGTGTGKSVGYGAGIIASGQRAVVATSSIALQDQLTKKDLPLIAQQLGGLGITFAVLKGRSNYVCKLDLETAGVPVLLGSKPEVEQGQLVEVAEDRAEELEGLDTDELERIAVWADTSATGDRAELPFVPSHATWAAVSRTSESCPGRTACPKGETCFAFAAHDRAAEADVVVVNTHLYAMHVASRGHVLPEHSAVVFDEAHEVESILSSALGNEISGAYALNVIKEVRRVLADDRLIGQLRGAARNLIDAIEAVSPQTSETGRHDDLRLPDGAASKPELKNALDSLAYTVGNAQRSLKDIDTQDAKARVRIQKAQGALGNLLERINDVSRSSTRTVVWIEGGRVIKTAPIDVGAILEGWFWKGLGTNEAFDASEDDQSDTDEVPGPRAVVFTSATVPKSMIERLRIPTGEIADMGSPFDFKANSILYVPSLPDPKKEVQAWKAASHEQMRTLIDAAGGRTLALFTSFSAMHEAVDAIGDDLSQTVLVQGQGLTNRALLEAFAVEESSCLFATRSFFQGIDVPGRALSLVILDRIPFARPGDPLVEAWIDAAGGGFRGFSKVAVPMAATQLAQAGGRLIRTATDRGVVAVLDPRLAEASYRAQLLAVLPPMRRCRDQDEVCSFLREAVGTEVAA